MPTQALCPMCFNTVLRLFDYPDEKAYREDQKIRDTERMFGKNAI